MDVFPFFVADDVHRALVQRQVERAFVGVVGGVAEVIFPMGFVAPVFGVGFAFEEGAQACAVALHGRGEAQRVEHGRHDVDVFSKARHGLAARPVCRLARVADDQRDLVGGVEIAAFAEQPMVAHLLAVVGGENDHRPVPAAALLEVGDEAAYLLIDQRHQPVIDRLQPAEFLFIRRCAVELFGKLLREPGVLPAFAQRRVRPRKARHVGGVIHGVEGFGCDEGWMRTQE